jgi:hypothetical protein
MIGQCARHVRRQGYRQLRAYLVECPRSLYFSRQPGVAFFAIDNATRRARGGGAQVGKVQPVVRAEPNVGHKKVEGRAVQSRARGLKAVVALQLAERGGSGFESAARDVVSLDQQDASTGPHRLNVSQILCRNYTLLRKSHYASHSILRATVAQRVSLQVTEIKARLSSTTMTLFGGLACPRPKVIER